MGPVSGTILVYSLLLDLRFKEFIPGGACLVLEESWDIGFLVEDELIALVEK